MDDGLRKNDPYRGMQSGGDEIRPGFLRGSKSAEQKEVDSKEAVNDLKSAENAAGADAPTQSETGLAGVRRSEENTGGFYSGAGRKSDGKKQGRFKGVLKKRGPIVAIFMLIFGVGGIMGATQLFQPFSLLAQFQETFNSMHVSANMRSSTFFRMQMDSGRYKDPIQNKWTVFNGETFKISSKQQAKLAAQGIEYDDNYDGTGIRVLKFDDGTGQTKIVTADVDSANKIGNGAVDFRTIYAENADFFNGYNKGSMTWRGAIANWFGTMTAKFLSSNKLTRNLFDGFLEKVKASNDGNTRKVALELMAKGAEEIEGGGYKTRHGEVDEETVRTVRNPDGSESTVVEMEKISPDGIEPGKASSARYELPESDISRSFGKMNRTNLTPESVRAKLNDISGTVQKGANIACTVSNVIGAVSLLVTASEAIQIIHLATAYFEVFDKVKAGYGDDSPIHELANTLNEKKENTNVVLEQTGYMGVLDSADNITESGIQALKTEEKKTKKSAMEAAGVTALYGGGAVDPNDPSVKSFNFTGNIKRILGGIGVSMAGFETCAIAKLVSNGVSALTSAIEIAGCILSAASIPFTFGIGSIGVGSACGALVGKVAKSIAVSVAIGVTVAAVISTITPIATNALMRDIITDIGGENLGNALTSGANMYLGNAHRSNGGSLATIDKYKEFAVAQQQVIAENARLERQTKDPFDITSKYTFMGTLLTQMMNLRSISSLMGALSSISSVVSSSVVAMSPTASAYNIADSLPENMEEYAEVCPYLASINAVGDAFCNPYSVTDVSTMGYDPSLDVIGKLANENSFLDEPTSDGNVRINGKSDLAKYILFCDNRTSAFGIADQNIMSQVSSWGAVQTDSATFNNVTNSAIGAVPIIGDVIDVVQNKDALANLGYVSGESCVTGNTVTASQSPDWDTAKYYQRFIEDQSLAESMGVINESAVTAFLDDYYEKNPLDNSYEGMLARYSGLDKETVIALLDLIDYGNYIANYHPEERYAFSAPAVETEEGMNFDSENIAGNRYILLDEISFSDIRNRSFAV